jgi:hypothetical protein
MKASLTEKYSHKSHHGEQQFLGVEPDSVPDSMCDTSFEFVCHDAPQPFATNYMIGFNEGKTFAASEYYAGVEGEAEAEPDTSDETLVICLRCGHLQKLGEVCRGCGIQFKRRVL